MAASHGRHVFKMRLMIKLGRDDETMEDPGRRLPGVHEREVYLTGESAIILQGDSFEGETLKFEFEMCFLSPVLDTLSLYSFVFSHFNFWLKCSIGMCVTCFSRIW